MKTLSTPPCSRWFLCAIVALSTASVAAQTPDMEPIAPGVWKATLGVPEPFTPTSFRSDPVAKDALGLLPPPVAPPFPVADIRFRAEARGCVVELPMTATEQIYGLGARQPAFNVTGKRINILVTDDPDKPDGSGHAPAPFYVSTLGYGVYVDTLRYARFYCGNLARADLPLPKREAESGALPADSLQDLYKARDLKEKTMTIEVPVAGGVDVYFFAGPGMLNAIRRYNLFSGGGCLPPLWGLGIYYRGYGKYNAEEVMNLARYFRAQHIPCDVFGLEPGWHTHAYSCSYVWSPERWPDPDAFLAAMHGMHYQLNLWEHAFVHPTAPFHAALKPYCGEYLVWEGLVPDFTLPEARRLFCDYHEQEFVAKGVTGFKLDECDNQPQHDHPWSFPELCRFPSGLDGEQMHSLFGMAYQRALTGMFRKNNIRTYGKVRASHALAAPSPFVLYSDGYDHRNYVRGLLNSGFCGTLWQPEVRVATSIPELYRRIETMIFSPQAVLDAWFMPHPTWQQIDESKNKAHILMPEKDAVEAQVRELFQWRMRFIPYLYSAFAEYRAQGTPPFRALVADYPDDPRTYALDDEYLIGEALLAAPIFGADTSRKVYLPSGAWYCFWTQTRYDGGQEITVEMPAERMPLFIKDNRLFPLADPVEYVASDTRFDLTVLIFGTPESPFTLYEDDGVSYDFERGVQNRVMLQWTPDGGRIERSGPYSKERYSIREWKITAAAP